METRLFSGYSDLRAMQRLAQEVWRLAPEHIDIDGGVGGMAWTATQHIGREREWKRRLWFDDGRPLAWGWVFQPASLLWQVRADHAQLHDEILDWFEAATEGPRDVSVSQANAAGIEALQAHNYVPDPTAERSLGNVRELDDLEDPVVPSGYVLKTMREYGNYEARVDIHRIVWHPSRVTNESYANVRSTWPYRDDLDCVIEGPDGSLVAYTLAWCDDETGLGEFEPVGVHPDHRRLGLGRAVNLFALHRLREAGARTALVGCVEDEKNPGPKALYRSVGFRELNRNQIFKR